MNTHLHFLAGGGAMGERIRAMCWDDTPLGVPELWPAALRTLVSLMLASNQPMFVAWGATRVLLYNDAYAGILGSKHPDALGRDFLQVWYEIRDDLAPIVGAAFRGEAVQMDDITLVLHRHGYPEETHFSFFYSPVRDGGDEVAGLFCACNEITNQVLAEKRLEESEARHRSVLANMDEAFMLLDRDFDFLEVNKVAARLVAMSREQLIGRNHWAVFPDTYDMDVGRMYRRVMAEREPGSIELQYEFPDGRAPWFEVRTYPVGDGIALFFRDITQRRRMAAEAALAAERVQLALDAGAIVGTWVWDVPGDVFVADERFAKTFDLDPGQCREGLALEVPMESIHVEDRPHVQAAVADALERGGAYRCEYRVRQDDGTYRWVEANGRVEHDAAGRPLRFPGVLLDIEARRRTEMERDRADALLRTFIEAVPGVVYAKDRQGRLIVANRGTAELLGLPPESFIGRTDLEVLGDKAQAEAVTATDRRIMKSGAAEQVEEEVRYPDGTPARWLSTKAPLRNAEGDVIGLIGSSVDITHRKQMEDALRLSEQRSALAMDVAQLGTWSWDLQSGVVIADDRCREICGLPQDGGTLALEQLAQHVHPDDWPRVEQSLNATLDPDGPGTYSEEFRWLHSDGRTVWTMSRGLTLFDPDGPVRVPVTMIGSVIDVTERRRILETLQQADQRKDEFLAMLAHELRNPLAPISTSAQLLKVVPGDEARVRQAADIIARQVGHMIVLVDDLLDVSRVTRGQVKLEREPVDLRSVVASAVEQVEPLIQARRQGLVTRVAAGAFIVVGDRHRLVQVVSNLLNNAAKYTPEGGRIELSFDAVDDRAVIRIADDGIGMDERLVPHVFELFTQAARTPDRSQGGLGIGLALVRSIVHLHGGAVSAYSPGPGKGSTFTVSLPLAAGVDAAAGAPPSSPQPRAGSKHILVVDDNRDAADTLAVLLRLLGHTVSVAADGGEALMRVAKGTRWDGFILDIGLPDMTGYELAGRLKNEMEHRSSLFIALTGYGQEHDLALSRAAGFDHHLIKPAHIDQLQRILDGHGRGG